MRHLAVYLMLQLGGNASPTKEDISKALSAVGIETDSARLDKMMAELEGKTIEELMEAGKDMLATFGGGGGGGAAAAGAGGDAPAAAAKVEEKEEEVEMDLGGGMDMFGGEEGGGGGGDY
jgi:ribosomal protein L12E/L44/L45/RPP1/RPP2